MACSVWYPTIQFTCKIANPGKGEKTWKSVNVSNFVTPPPGYDKRSSKADEFSILYKSHPDNAEFPESYTIRANLGLDLQISLEVQRPAAIPGWKLGKGPQGGFSYFGTNPKSADGYVIHRFWPRFKAAGHIIRSGQAEPVEGFGTFIHAIQGMRPNLVASAWNFATFQSNDLGGVSAVQMEFTTQPANGKHGAGSGGAVVNIGSLVIGDKLACITAETKWPGEESTGPVISRATHINPEIDPDTSYGKPKEILYEWKAPSILPDAPGTVEAKLSASVGSVDSPQGLVEKVDVLAEIPYVLKVAVNYVAGTKPFIYQVRFPQFSWHVRLFSHRTSSGSTPLNSLSLVRMRWPLACRQASRSRVSCTTKLPSFPEYILCSPTIIYNNYIHCSVFLHHVNHHLIAKGMFCFEDFYQ